MPHHIKLRNIGMQILYIHVHVKEYIFVMKICPPGSATVG